MSGQMCLKFEFKFPRVTYLPLAMLATEDLVEVVPLDIAEIGKTLELRDELQHGNLGQVVLYRGAADVAGHATLLGREG